MVFVSLAAEAKLPAHLEDFKLDVERRALAYFLDHSHPQTGLVRDKARNFGPTPSTNVVASIAATGFGLTVLANAAERGLLSRPEAEERVLRTLRFVENRLHRHHGWLHHFIDWSTGVRAWNSEISTIDTALFLAGALYAGEVLGGEAELIAERLYRDVDFHEFMTDGGARPAKRTLSLSYTPEAGFVPYQWSEYAEQMILLILGLGHPTKPLPIETWKAWKRQSVPLPGGSIMALELPLFIHQYSHAFVDFRVFSDGHPNYFENSVKATFFHRNMARFDARSKTLREGFWGFSAGLSANGYDVYSPFYHGGTVCIGCAIASTMFAPVETLEDGWRWRTGPHREKVWGLYGFVDSLDLDGGWFARDVLGITVGPAYMAAANVHGTTSIWRTFMKIDGVRRGLERAAR